MPVLAAQGPLAPSRPIPSGRPGLCPIPDGMPAAAPLPLLQTQALLKLRSRRVPFSARPMGHGTWAMGMGMGRGPTGHGPPGAGPGQGGRRGARKTRFVARSNSGGGGCGIWVRGSKSGVIGYAAGCAMASEDARFGCAELCLKPEGARVRGSAGPRVRGVRWIRLRVCDWVWSGCARVCGRHAKVRGIQITTFRSSRRNGRTPWPNILP